MPESPARQAKLDRMQRLLEISRNLASTHELPLLLQIIVDHATELTQSEAASIMLYDQARGELRFEAVHGPLREKLGEVTVPLKGSVAGWIFHHAKPKVLHDATQDPRVYRAVDKTLSFQTRSLLGVPLLIKQEPIGVIEAVNKKKQGHYTEDDLAILETLAAQAAVAIDNARLLSRLQTVNTELHAPGPHEVGLHRHRFPRAAHASWSDLGACHLPERSRACRIRRADGSHHPELGASQDHH